MAIVYLGLGSNLGEKEKNLRSAIELIENEAGKIIKCSKFRISDPVGFESPNSFLNAAISIETELSPLELLRVTQDIEKKIGRKKKSNGVYSDRIIDIDILLYDQLEMSTQVLSIPHPHMHKRFFVLNPLAEIEPELMHPTSGKSVKELLANLRKKSD